MNRYMMSFCHYEIRLCHYERHTPMIFMSVRGLCLCLQRKVTATTTRSRDNDGRWCSILENVAAAQRHCSIGQGQGQWDIGGRWRLYIYIYTYILLWDHICIRSIHHAFLHLYTYIYICMSVCVYTYVYIYIYNIHIHMCKHIYIYANLHIYIYIYTYNKTSNWSISSQWMRANHQHTEICFIGNSQWTHHKNGWMISERSSHESSRAIHHRPFIIPS